MWSRKDKDISMYYTYFIYTKQTNKYIYSILFLIYFFHGLSPLPIVMVTKQDICDIHSSISATHWDWHLQLQCQQWHRCTDTRNTFMLNTRDTKYSVLYCYHCIEYTCNQSSVSQSEILLFYCKVYFVYVV